jgi:hypothetical protein
MLKLVCKKQSHGQKYQEKEGWSGKRRVESGLWHWKLKTLAKTRFASKVIMFEEKLEFKKNCFVLWAT